MNRIALVKVSQGFQSANQRPGCRCCVHVADEMDARDLHSWRCTKGGFFTSALAICDQFERQGTTKGTPK